MKRRILYLNTDLVLIAPHNLAPLADVLAHRGIFALNVLQGEDDSWFAKFETKESFLEPEPNIAAMLTAIESLDEPSRSLWVACTFRDFNIGYECGDEPWAFNQQLSAPTLARIAASSASLVITIYPAEPPSRQRAESK